MVIKEMAAMVDVPIVVGKVDVVGERAGADGALQFELTNLRAALAAEGPTPHLAMCDLILAGDYAAALQAFEDADTTSPIDQIEVVFTEHGEQVPKDFEEVRSVADGGVDLGAKKIRVVLLCTRNGVESAPITALSFIYEDLHQEPPLGFFTIEKSIGGRTADLSMGNGGQRMFLCGCKGTGPPIRSIGLFFAARKGRIPPGWHIIAKTPYDDPADLNNMASKAGNEVFLCYRLDLRDLIRQFGIVDVDAVAGDSRWAASVALIIASQFSPKESVIIQSLKSLRELMMLPRGLNTLLNPSVLNLVFRAVCNAQVIARSQFSRSVQALGLQALLDGFLRYGVDLHLETVFRVYETFFFERQKDRREIASIQISDYLFLQQKDTRSVSFMPTPTPPDGVAAAAHNKPAALFLIDRDEDPDSIRSWIHDSLLPGIAEAIVVYKSTQRDVNNFQRYRGIDWNFRHDMSDLIIRLIPARRSDRLIIGLLMTASKIASHPTAFRYSASSETSMRKVQAMTLMLSILSQPCSVDMFTPAAPLLILRRFVCVSLLEAFATVVPAIFKLALSLFTELWQRYKHLLKTELGIIMDAVLLGMLQSPNCWPEQKIDLIETIARLFPTPRSLIDLFYNYDNDLYQTRTLFGRLVRSLCELCEGRISSPMAKPRPKPSSQPHPIQTAFVQSIQEANASQMNLQRTALSTVITFLEHLAQFLAPSNVSFNDAKPSTSRSASVMAPQIPMLETLMLLSPMNKVITKQASFNMLFAHESTTPSDSDVTTPPSPMPHKRSASWCEVDSHEQLEEKKSDARDKRIRSSTWVTRHMQQKKAQLLHAEAIALARSESIKSAVALLISRRGSYDAVEIAMFLNMHSASLDKVEIGDFIATDFNRYMDADQFGQLRTAFVTLIDFTSLDLDSALRHFLVHSGFRLPGEAQKVDRLIQAFADAYVRDNPGLYPNAEAVYLVAFALIMLNTDIHDPRLRHGKQNRAPMTKAQFVRNVQGADTSSLSAALLSSLFDGIAAKSIEWQTPSDSVQQSSYQLETSSTVIATKAISAATEKQFHHDCELLCRQGLAWLKSASVRSRMYITTDSKHIVKGMFEVIFPCILLALTTVLERDSDFDVEIKTACVDGLKFSSVIALAVNSEEELSAFMGVLAKITYIEHHKPTMSPAQIRKNIVSGEHNNQQWVNDLKVQVANRSKKAVHSMIQVANRTKKRLVFERDQGILLNIQSEFTDEVLLVDPERLFIREGHLTKISSANKLQIYRFFLFSDLLLYAREQFQKLKLHKVVHLSMCTLHDIPEPVTDAKDAKPSDKHAFKILSPQKSFTVTAPSHDDKVMWMKDIQKNIDICINRHKALVEAMRALPKDSSLSLGSATLPSQPEHKDEVANEADGMSLDGSMATPPTSTSRFMPNFIRPKSATSPSPVVNTPRGCRFCIRDYSLMRRKYACAWCSQSVCTACSSHRLELATDALDTRSPKKVQRVCDACFVLLNCSTNATIADPPSRTHHSVS